MRTCIVILLAIFFAFSCKNNKANSIPVSPVVSGIKAKGILNNKTGLDGCSWVIKLNVKDAHGHEYLEPINLNSFNLTLVEGKAVELTYIEDESGSACMVGTVVLLKTIKQL
jgi:hypothetical protein